MGTEELMDVARATRLDGTKVEMPLGWKGDTFEIMGMPTAEYNAHEKMIFELCQDGSARPMITRGKFKGKELMKKNYLGFKKKHIEKTLLSVKSLAVLGIEVKNNDED